MIPVHLIAAAASESNPGPPWMSLLYAVLMAVGGISGIVAVLNLPKTRRKIDAETTQVLTGAAVALVEPLREQVEQLSNRVALLEADKVRMEVEKARHAALLLEHAKWDERARLQAAKEDPNFPSPPPLFPSSS